VYHTTIRIMPRGEGEGVLSAIGLYRST